MTSEASARLSTLRFAHPTRPTEWRRVMHRSPVWARCALPTLRETTLPMRRRVGKGRQAVPTGWAVVTEQHTQTDP